MEFSVWATPGENRKLFGKVKTNGADDLTLSDFDATTGFLAGKSGKLVLLVNNFLVLLDGLILRFYFDDLFIFVSSLFLNS